MRVRNHHEKRVGPLGLAFGLVLAGVSSQAAAAPHAPHATALRDGGRDPLGTVRTTIRPRVWVLLDTSVSMDNLLGKVSRFAAARGVIRRIVDSLEFENGEPLVHWRLAAFQRFVDEEDGMSQREICADPTMGAGLPDSSSPGPPRTPVRCGGVQILSDLSGCDAEAGRRALLRNLPRRTNADKTPNGIALYQLASHIARNATGDLQTGQRNIIVLITDGLDTCECMFHPWLDFNEGTAGQGGKDSVRLRASAATPDSRPFPNPAAHQLSTWNAGLKAKAAFLALNGGDPDAGLGDIYVVGMAMPKDDRRKETNHLAWMASYGRRPALYADRPEGLREALDQVLGEVTLPSGDVTLAAPRLATIKELVASSPSSTFAGSDPELAGGALVAGGAGGDREQEVLRLRASYPDNILLSTSAELRHLRGRLRALPTSSGAVLGDTPIWDAGVRLAARDPADRLVLFNRPGSRALRPFRVGAVTPEDLGVTAGYLSELDGIGARTAEDAARIVVRLVLGNELSVHPDTRTIYGPAGDLNITGGRGTWKLREGLASPVAVTNPPRYPGRVTRNQSSYRAFFTRHLNRRTMVYLPTSGGMIHAFAGDTGEEVFAYIPDDVLGPAPSETAPERPFLRDLALAGVRGAAGLRRGLVNDFTLAGSPTVRDVFLPAQNDWRTVLSFGRSFGGRFLTALDVSDVGDGWTGDHDPPRPRPGGPGLPRLLFNIGNRGERAGLTVDELGETPEPLMAEVPASAGSEWLMFVSAGEGRPGDDSGEWLLAVSIEDGAIRARHRLEPSPSAVIAKNGAPAAAAPWRPAWAVNGAPDTVTRVYVADLHGQIHRLDLSDPGAWDFGVGYRLGGAHPILTPPVVFPFPGRAEPHLLVVTGGDRRVPDTPSVVALLRDDGTGFAEVWRRALADGEFPQGRPAVLTDGSRVAVALATRTITREALSCDVVATRDGVARLRGFDGLTGADMAGVVDSDASTVIFGAGRIQGISLSSSGNLALSVSSVGGKVVDSIIGDFKFRVSDGALEDVTLFVEGFRRSPFWVR